MSEVACKMEIYGIEWECDKCHKGFMRMDKDGYVLTTYPAQFRHRCTNCGHTELSTKSYPYQIFHPISITKPRDEWPELKEVD